MNDSLNEFFQEKLVRLDCEEFTKSYIISIFMKYRSALKDLSRDSITLKYANAKYNHRFEEFQDLGDWIFFYHSFNPTHSFADYYRNIGQISYYRCYGLINKQWKVFEEMADKFRYLEKQTYILLK